MYVLRSGELEGVCAFVLHLCVFRLCLSFCSSICRCVFSVLENYHVVGGFRFLREDANNIFVRLSASDRREIEQVIYRLVMATSLYDLKKYLEGMGC